MVTGVGGTGVVTIGALLGMARTSKARGRGARHGGPRAEGRLGLLAHPHSPRKPEQIHAVRIAAGDARWCWGAT
jgi:indolepyruvate ferredoxin oxidoreductase